MGWRRRRFLCSIVIVALAAAASRAQDAQPATAPATLGLVRFGVLAYRGADEAQRTWQPTADYLQSQIPSHRFQIVALEYDRINDAVARGEVDFVVTNPTNYVDIEGRYGATRIASLMTLGLGGARTHYAGVIFCRNDRADIASLKDVAGKSFMGTDTKSLGGWWAAIRELRTSAGIDPRKDCKLLPMGGTQDNVVFAVRDGKADVGTVRAGEIEQLESEGKIDSGKLRILNPQAADPRVPFARSTAIYPEGAIARLTHTSDDVAREVTIALLRQRSVAAQSLPPGVAGWTIPLDYSPVHELMRELREGPYRDFGRVSLRSAARQFRYWLAAAATVIVLLVSTSVYLLLLNRKLTGPIERTQEGRLARRLRKGSRVCAAAVIVIGLMVLIGWAAEVEALKRVLPGLVAMNPLTAVTLVLCGIGLMALGRSDSRAVARIGGMVCGGIALMIGGVMVTSYVTGRENTIDRLLFPEAVDVTSLGAVGRAEGDSHPNRMAPNTALNFVLIGLALLTINVQTRRHERRPAQLLAVLSGILSLLALLGYAYGVKPLTGVASFIPMALHTALSFVLLSMGILWVHPERGLMASVTSESTGGVLARRLLPACVLVPAFFGWLSLAGERDGLYGSELGTSLHAIGNIVFFLVLAWWNAGLLFRADVQRLRADAALTESEQRHRAVVEQASEGIILTDVGTRMVIEANAALAKLLGYELDELIGIPVYELIADTRDNVDLRIEKVLAAKQPLVGERQFRRRDGSPVDVESSAVVVEWSGRRVIFTVVRDITERKRSQQVLATERNLLRTVIDNLPESIYVKDAHGRYVLDNRAHAEKLGKTDGAHDVVGKTVFDFFPPEIAEAYERDDQEVMRAGHAMLDREERWTDPLGQERWLTTTKVPLRDGQGNVVGIVGLSRDVTERRRAQQLVEQKNLELEALAAAEHHANEQLKSAQSQLVQTEKLAGLGQMVAGVAHEINNPLSFVSNNVAVLERDVRGLAKLLELYKRGDDAIKTNDSALAVEIAELSERIDLAYSLTNIKELTTRSRDGLKRIQQIVRDLRDFARLDRGEQQDCDLNAGIESTLNIIAGRAKKKQVQLVKELGTLPLYTCHGAKINQVVMNLVANAIDASRENTTVTVTSAQSDGEIRIAVRDHGSGIEPSVRERIFDPFFTTKPQGEGTGLGLSISYGIIRDHGGRIEVESELGKGSTFTIALPVKGHL